MFISGLMEESFRHKLNLKVKIFKLSLKKEESKVSVKLKSLIGSVSFYKFSHKEVIFYFIQQLRSLPDCKLNLVF